MESNLLFNFDFDDDHTESEPDEKPSREKRLANAFKQPAR